MFLILFPLLLLPSAAALLLRMGGGPTRGATLAKLLDLVTSSNRGLFTDNNNACKELIDRIEDEQADVIQRDRNFIKKCEGNWQLLWTTEKETLFFAKNGLFGAPCTTISQSIDLTNGVINNLIEFESGRKFSVLGSCAVDETDQRKFNFSFKSAQIVLPPFVNLSLPPVGKGSFVNVFANEKYRVSKDSRGDYLCLRREE